MRNQVYLSNVDYLGTIELCLPSFTGHREIFPSLGYLAPLSNPEDRLGLLVSSSTRLGTEITRTWSIVRREATQISECLGEELPEILDVGPEEF